MNLRDIGEKVWVARFEAMAPAYVTCPDCGGTGRLRVIMHDESIVSVDCQNCSCGYERPSGQVLIYRQSVRAELSDITGFEAESGKVQYKTSGGYIHSAEDVFDDREAALAWGNAKQEEYQQEQRDRVAKKEKETRSWAWNASYHRKCIKDAQRQIEYHTAKLSVAAIKAKEPEQAA